MKKVLAFLFRVSFTVLILYGANNIGTIIETKVIGPDYNKADLVEFDTTLIESNYNKFDHYEDYENGEKVVRVRFNDNKQKVKIIITIYEINKFSQKGSVRADVFDSGSKDSRYTNLLIVEKNNISIYAREYTSKKRSNTIQKYIEYVISQFKSDM